MFLYVSSLKKHLQNLHLEFLKEDNTGHKWEEYCKTIKICEAEGNPNDLEKHSEDSATPPTGIVAEVPKKAKPKRKKKSVKENSDLEEGIETTITQNKIHLQTEFQVPNPEMVCAGSPEVVIKEDTKEEHVDSTKTAIEECKRILEPVDVAPEPVVPKQPTAYETCDKCAVQNVPEAVANCAESHPTQKTLEERIKDSIKNLPYVPTYALDHSEHHHFHCEFCGHPMIVHGDHTDFIHDAELHLVTEAGTVYPHKLAVSESNPIGCRPLYQYPSHADVPSNTNEKSESTIEQITLHPTFGQESRPFDPMVLSIVTLWLI